MKISIIIATMNRPDCLKDIVLKSILGQHLDCSEDDYIEVIVVDASDNTESEHVVSFYKEPFRMSGIDLKYVKSEKKGLVYQRKLGFTSSMGDIIGYLDDDCEISYNGIDVIKSEFKSLNIAGLGFKVIMRNNRNAITDLFYKLIKKVFLIEPFWGSGRLITKAGYNYFNAKNDKEGFVPWLSGCCMIYRRDVLSNMDFPLLLQKYGGYSLCEDVYFSVAASQYGKLLVTNKATANHIYYPSGRSKNRNFYCADVFNRYFVLKELIFPRISTTKFFFYWSLIGIFIIDLFKALFQRDMEPIFGYLQGVKEIVNHDSCIQRKFTDNIKL